jgi:hypothetical protein
MVNKTCWVRALGLLAICACWSSVRAEIIYSNMPPPGTQQSGWLVGTNERVSPQYYQSVAAAFTTDSYQYSLVSVTGLLFSRAAAQYDSGIIFSLYQDSGVGLGNLISTSAPLPVGYNTTEVVWTLQDTVHLTENTNYWVRAQAANPLGRYAWSTYVTAPGVMALSTDDVNWTVQEFGQPFMSVVGTKDPGAMIAPEPETLCLLAVCILPVVVLIARRHR